MLIVTFILSVLGLLIALLAYRGTRALGRRIDELHRSLYPTMMRQQDAITRLERRMQLVASDLKRRFGELICRPETMVSEALEMDPGLRDQLLGHLPSGALAATLNPSHTMQAFSRAYNVDLDTLLRNLNLFLEDPAAFRTAQAQHGSLIQVDSLSPKPSPKPQHTDDAR